MIAVNFVGAMTQRRAGATKYYYYGYGNFECLRKRTISFSQNIYLLMLSQLHNASWRREIQVEVQQKFKLHFSNIAKHDSEKGQVWRVSQTESKRGEKGAKRCEWHIWPSITPLAHYLIILPDRTSSTRKTRRGSDPSRSDHATREDGDQSDAVWPQPDVVWP